MFVRNLIVICCLFLLLIILAISLFIRQSKHTTPISTSSQPLPPKRRSNLTLFFDGRQFFDALEKQIHQAEHHIHLSFYIFRNDAMGKTLLEYLKEKAKAGVQIRLLLDAIGCRSFPKSLQLSLNASGVEVAFSNPPTFRHPIASLNQRNHRKIAVIDGKVGFYGGFNVGDEYIGLDSKMGHWRDYHIQVEGESVRDLQDSFLRDWEKARGPLKGDPSLLYPPVQPGKNLVQMVPTPDAAYLEDLFISHLSNAHQHVFIGTPYFIPSERLMNTLLELLRKGVSITILLPSKKDHPMVKPLSYHFIEPLLKQGAKFYHFYLGFYHAKMFLVDGKICYLGTANFDKRSLFLNEEFNSFIYDEDLITQIQEKTQRDLLYSIELTMTDLLKRNWLERSKTALTYPFAPLL